MQARYTAAITDCTKAGHDMIEILIIDNHAIERSKKEILDTVVHKNDKDQILHKYRSLFGRAMHVIDASTPIRKK